MLAGGVGAYAASAYGITSTAVGTAAFAGAAGGAAAGATSAALTGGNVWQGALTGLAGGAVGGGIGSYVGGLPGVFAGAWSGGGAAGAVGAAFHGGNFINNAINGAIAGGATQAAFATVQLGAFGGWAAARDWTDDSSVSGSGADRTLSDGSRDTTVTRLDCRGCGESASLFKPIAMNPEGSLEQKLFGIRYEVDTPFGQFINRVSKVHDLLNGWSYENWDYVPRGAIFDTSFDVYSMLMMAPSAAYTGFSFYGSSYYFPGVR